MGNFFSALRDEAPDDAGHATPSSNSSSPTTIARSQLAQPETLPPANHPGTQDSDTITDTQNPTVDMLVRSTVPPSTRPKYDVFISHAGDDKATIALPLRERLTKQGITAFVDQPDLSAGRDAINAMTSAMLTAKVAVVVLSPEFVSRRWPMRELMCFLRRRKENASSDPDFPRIIPVFYRLTIDELNYEPRLDRLDKNGNKLCETPESKFYERRRLGEPEANVGLIKKALKDLRRITGVTNDFDASNDSSALMDKRRDKLLEELCDKVRQAVSTGVQSIVPFVDQDNGNEQNQGSANVFRRFFPTKSRQVRAVLDFKNCTTPEGNMKQLLLDETSDSPRVFSIHGMGGVGKSTIVRALCTDDEICQRFPDGVHLMKLGKDATSTVLLHQICQALDDSGAQKASDDLRVKNNIDKALCFFEKWFDGKKCAFFIDDAWDHGIDHSLLERLCEIGNREHLEGRNHVLITTRQDGIAALAPKENTVHMAPREARGLISRRILFFYAGYQQLDRFPVSIDEFVNTILDICAGLPVSLAVAGKSVKQMRLGMRNDNDKEVWKRYLSHLRISRERLLRTDVATSWGKYENLFATIVASLKFLDEKPREELLGFQSPFSFVEMYRRLCVLQKQAVVPPSMLKHLWKVESDEYADVIATTLVQVGLAGHETKQVDGESVWCLSLHDSLHDFALADAERNEAIKEAHACLLEGYKSCDPEISCEVNGTLSWWSRKLETDGYIHRNLCYHLLGAGRTEELCQLLLCPQWAERQVEVNGIPFLDADLLLATKAMQDVTGEPSDEEGSETRRALELLAEAVALSFRFVGRNVAELCFQLTGRLKGFRESCRPIEKYLSWIETDAERPKILCDSSCLQEPGEIVSRIIPICVPIWCMTAMKDSERVVCGCEDGQVFVVDTRRGVVEKRWKVHDKRISAITVSRDRTRIVSGSWDTTAKVWNVNTGDCVTIFEAHINTVSGVAVLADGRRVISVSWDDCAFLWDMERGQILSSFFPGPEVINCVAMLGDEEVAVMGGDDGKLRLWNLAANEQVCDTFDGHEYAVTSVTVTPNGKQIVSGSSDATVRVWDVGSHQQIASFFIGIMNFVDCLAVSEDGGRIASGSSDCKIRIWELKSGTQICDPLEGHLVNRITGLSFLAGADRIVSSSVDGSVRVWDVTRENRKNFRNRHDDAVSGVSFTPDGEFVLSASWDHTLRIWNTTSGQQVGDPLRGHSSFDTDVAVTPNGKYMLSVSWDNTLRVWDFESRQLLRTFTGHTECIECVAVTPQGDRAVTGSWDTTVRVWNLTAIDGSHFVLEGHSAPVESVFVSDDGLRTISVDREDNIFVWDLETRKLDNRFKMENAWKLSRRQVLGIVVETTVLDDTKLSIPLGGRQIFDGEGTGATLLATMEADICSWALSPSKKMICLGLADGQVLFLKLVT